MARSGKVPAGHTKLKHHNRDFELQSKYKHDYPYMLIDHMKEGLSFEAFGGIAMVGRQALHGWLEKYPKFQQAKDIGESLGRIFWERQGIFGMQKGKEFNAGVWMFNMKNRFSWHDEMKHVIQGSVDFNQKIDTKYLRNLIKRDPFLETPQEKDVTPKDAPIEAIKAETPVNRG